MAGAACKVIINDLTGGLAKSLETVLAMPWVREKIGNEKADALLQEMVDLDTYLYRGSRESPKLPARGLMHIIADLEKLGVFTDEVWLFLRAPGPTAAVKG